MNKIYLSWEGFERDIETFSNYLGDFNLKENTIILGVKRGGFTTSATLSNRLGFPVSTVKFQSRDGNDTKPIFLESEMINKDSTVIIPDDIYDTGLTINTIIKKLTEDCKIPLRNIIGLFHFHNGAIKSELIHYKAIKNTGGLWAVLPWE